MENNSPICIVGGYDLLSKSYFNELKRKYRNVFFINIGIENFSEYNLHNFKIYQLKKILDFLNFNSIKDIIFLGKIIRPNLLEFKNDGIVEKYIPMLFESYKIGDSAVLNTVIKIFKKYNFRVVSPFKYSDEFKLRACNISNVYSEEDMVDIKKSSNLLNAISKFDNAQSIVSVNGYIIAIEAVEGTDAMLQRVRKIRKNIDQLINKAGFLVKKPKSNQSKLIDLPVIGPKTIRLVKKANLKGIAIDCQNTMVYRKSNVLALINDYDLKIYNIN